MPRKADYSDDELRLVATLYYVDGLGQAEITNLVRVSQTKISRMLAVALERGIVRISVDQYNARNPKLEHELCARFGLTEVAVVKTAPNANPETARQTVGHFGAPFVSEQLPNSGTLAMGGGRSVSELVHRFRRNDARRLTIVQAMGSIDSNVSSVDSLELGRSLVKLWGGEFLTLSTPAFVEDKKTRDFFLASEQIRSVSERLKKADAAIVGVGPLDLSVYVERNVLDENDFIQLRKIGAVGEICGRFFDKNGRECASYWRDRVISIDLDDLRKIPQVIGISSGAVRAPAIAGALKGGMLKTLLTDESAAEALLAM
ncbi:deoxyribonucleoside regulator [Ereboglobus sp. PH5-5]|uniref:Sugar-binding domain-containing protein n=1 Tax=Ereboglobus luteus TaxID=1796921 RepID=A0A2U8E3I0_9BACT|nr:MULTISPECIES: sugar-binding domain-containing protein [Ereboglobus]AWI09370.1 hypothetical protein CKA38_09045 [Ereboglobus luteus]MDF9826154.1 deoxyribonucleoside regulator [Ereboglobus sp. PH5-10]MDF9832170.1 deoxyribonucleoside regulator [Ereboglobus sp. PH5-5]